MTKAKNAPFSIYHPRAFSDLVWAEARRRYLGGETAPVLCAEFGLSRSTFVKRARNGGWRKSDHAAPKETPRAASTDPRAAAVEAVARAALAAAAGNDSKAESSARVAERLLKTVSLLSRQGLLNLPCPHCGARPGDAMADREARAREVREEIERRLARLRDAAAAQPDGGGENQTAEKNETAANEDKTQENRQDTEGGDAPKPLRPAIRTL